MPPPPGSIGDLSDEDVAWVVANGIHQPVAAGRRLVSEGEEPDAVYVVLEGNFVVSSRGLGIDFLARLGPGEVVGDVVGAAGASALGTVRAETDATVLEIPRDRLDRRMRRDAGFAARFRHVVSGLTAERVRALREHADLPKPSPDGAEVRVHELIERLLRGDLL